MTTLVSQSAKRLPIGAVVPLLLLAATGCNPPARITPPPGYVPLRNAAPYDFKAVSARGMAVGMRSRANEHESADLKYWSAAVEHQKVDLDGMTLAGRQAIRSKDDVEGVLFQFESGQGASTLTYLIALYVTPARIVTIEAAGSAELLSADLPAIKESITSATVRLGVRASGSIGVPPVRGPPPPASVWLPGGTVRPSHERSGATSTGRRSVGQPLALAPRSRAVM